MPVEKVRGYIGATSNQIDQEASAVAIPVTKQQGHFHVTLITKEELQSLNTDQLNFLHEYLRDTAAVEQQLVNLGLGCNDKRSVYFHVIHWSQGAALRAKLKLPVKDFHVTLSARDDHTESSGLRRDITSVVQDRFNTALSERNFDTAFLAYFNGKRDSEACTLATLFRKNNPHSALAHLRFADTQQRLSQHKYAMLAYLYAASLLIDGPVKMRDYAVSRICKEARFTEFPCIYTEDETQQAELAVQDGFPKYLTAPSIAVQHAVQECFARDETQLLIPNDYSRCRVSLSSRERMFICAAPMAEPYKLPRFFRWLVPYRLAVMSTPRDKNDIDVLRKNLGITLVVTLTQETPLSSDWFKGTRVENLFMPIENYKAPSIAQVDHFIKRVEDLPKGEAALVHCGAGKGRAGTFAACYMAKYGFSVGEVVTEPRNAATVINLLRHMRPGSIETEEQERFVSKYVSHLWKTLAVDATTQTITEPSATPLQLDGPLPSNTRTIVLCGLPGSGKSTFATKLQETAPDRFQIISQDESGSRSAFISSLSTAVKSRARVIVDKCHPTGANRREVLAIAFDPSDALCVYFSYPAALCTIRADGRTSHPTIRQGSAERIVHRFAKEFVQPSRDEGFACIATVTSFDAANTLLHKLGGHSRPDVPPEAHQVVAVSAQPQVGLRIHKFPRTRHLLNLGAATRDDLILTSSDSAAFLTPSDGVTITLEEKVDGANMGISIDPNTLAFRVQNRSHYVNSKSHEQFRKLDAWLNRHSEDLRAIIEPGISILFGEWLFAQHSVPYTRLPDTFLVFDLYDVRENQFSSRAILAEKVAGTSLHQVPVVEPPLRGLSAESLMILATGTRSKFYDGLVEGIYIRREKNGVVIDRAKVVRNDFISGNEHWGKGNIKQNGVS